MPEAVWAWLCLELVGLAGSGLRIKVGVKSVAEMEVTRGAGLCNETVEGEGSSEDVGRDEVGDSFKLRVADEGDIVATFNRARTCRIPCILD